MWSMFRRTTRTVLSSTAVRVAFRRWWLRHAISPTMTSAGVRSRGLSVADPMSTANLPFSITKAVEPYSPLRQRTYPFGHSRRPTEPSFHFRNAYGTKARWDALNRSEEHTSELQSRFDLVCRLLLEK